MFISSGEGGLHINPHLAPALEQTSSAKLSCPTLWSAMVHLPLSRLHAFSPGTLMANNQAWKVSTYNGEASLHGVAHVQSIGDVSMVLQRLADEPGVAVVAAPAVQAHAGAGALLRAARGRRRPKGTCELGIKRG